MAKRIEVVDSVWRTNPGGTARSAGHRFISVARWVSAAKETAYVQLVRPLRLYLLIVFLVLVEEASFEA